ncbi:MAG: helix-turn-helix domain-containing protein [Alphaproteobacteria bacterium]|nr:helix-turn-helix domain-containing protein [Alphaproteobacteria bacterium]
MKYDLLHIQGKPYVLVPLHDFRLMSAGANDNSLPDHVLNELAARQNHPIKVIRKYRGMTQNDLAEASGISRPYLTEIETGKKDGSIRAMKAIAEALEVSVGDLTG